MSTDRHTETQQRISKRSRARKYVLAPFRGLRWVRDLYVRKMMSFADGSNHGTGPFCPEGAMSRAQSVRSTADDDLRELVRAASQRDYGSRLNLGKMGAGTAGATTPYVGTVPRSQTVAVGRIDEDKPVEFGLDVKIGPLYPRSRSEALPKSRAKDARLLPGN